MSGFGRYVLPSAATLLQQRNTEPGFPFERALLTGRSQRTCAHLQKGDFAYANSCNHYQ